MEVPAVPSLLLKPFHTCPNSPTHNASFLDSTLYFYVDTDPSTEFEDNNGGNDFEFEPNAQLEASICLGQHMSFADELFRSGQLLPLKLPPRLQTITGRNSRRPSSCATFRNPFVRHSPKCKDVDPFRVALEKVRKEDTTRGRDSPVRRARSLSPMRNSGWFQEQTIGTKKGDPCVNTQPSMKQIGMNTTEASRETVENRGSNRRVYKNILLAWSQDSREANGGKWKIWLKEVFKAMRQRPLAKNRLVPFMCFGHNL